MSISDIQTVFISFFVFYFGKEDGKGDVADIYNEVFGMEYQETKDVMKELSKKFTKAEESFPDVSGEEAEMLHRFSLICLLSYDIYIN